MYASKDIYDSQWRKQVNRMLRYFGWWHVFLATDKDREWWIFSNQQLEPHRKTWRASKDERRLPLFDYHRIGVLPQEWRWENSTSLIAPTLRHANEVWRLSLHNNCGKTNFPPVLSNIYPNKSKQTTRLSLYYRNQIAPDFSADNWHGKCVISVLFGSPPDSNWKFPNQVWFTLFLSQLFPSIQRIVKPNRSRSFFLKRCFNKPRRMKTFNQTSIWW